MRASFIAISMVAAACSGSDEDESGIDPAECFVGDPALAPEVELIQRSVDGQMAPLTDGGDVDLILPPQGGKVFLVGVRARNVDICNVRLSSAIRDHCTGRVVGRDGRPIFLVKGADGWAVPRQPHELSDYANVPACPSFGTERDVNDEPYDLELSFTDGRGRETVITSTVVPVCAEPGVAGQCECECDKDFRLGAACEPDPEPRPPAGTCPGGTSP